MDADVALKDFSGAAYVIERPAGADGLADKATAMLKKAGLRIWLDKEAAACREAEDAISARLPAGMEIIRRGRSDGARAPTAPVLVSAPPSGSATAALIDTWHMVGMTIHGYGCLPAAGFAIKAALSSGADKAEAKAHPLAAGLAAASGRRAFEVQPWGSAPHGPSFLDPDKFNAKSLKTAIGVHGHLLAVVNRAAEISEVRFEVVPGTGGVRSDKLQSRLKAAGKSRAKIGRHTIGHAIDLVPVDRKGRPDFSDLDGFDAIRDAMEAAAIELGIPIQWGGNWRKIVDKPHFELDRKVYPAEGEEPDPESILVAFR